MRRNSWAIEENIGSHLTRTPTGFDRRAAAAAELLKSDRRLGLNAGNPTHWIFARERSPQALLDAFAAGHVSASDAPTAERIEFSADTDADCEFETLMGDDRPADGRAVRFRVHIAGFRRNADYWVSVYRNGHLLHGWRPARAQISFVDLPAPGMRSAYRVELRSATDEAPIAADLIGMYGAMIGLTNPIYFGFASRQDGGCNDFSPNGGPLQRGGFRR